jgi:hypothetical protein
LGVTYPKPRAFVEILVGRFRGLVPLAPIVLAGPIGLALLGLARRARPAAIAAGLIVVYYVLFNAAYRYWNGGWSYGPRHLAPALPFACLGLAALWSFRGVALRWTARGLLIAGFAWGAAHSLVAVSTTAQPPEDYRRPVGQLLAPAFRDGDLSLNHQSFDEGSADARRLRGGKLRHDAWNLGEVFGLRGHASLAPLFVLWAAAGFGWWWLGRRPTATKDPSAATSARAPA